MKGIVVGVLKICAVLAYTSLGSWNVYAQDKVVGSIQTTSLPSANEGSILTRRDARTITLKIPAPRGQIVDRFGEPLVQSEVAYQLAIMFEQFEDLERDSIVNWARARLSKVNNLVKNLSEISDNEIFEHYRHRRWLPCYISRPLSDSEAKSIESKLPSGISLQPIYRRKYTHGALAAHIIGYSGSVGKLPVGPINFNEPLWEESEGRAGLEMIYDRELKGEPGMKRLLFDEKGNKLLEEQIKRPRPGGTIVTTLNGKWQLKAEEVLRKGCDRGAFVVLDVITGEVLVMASRPSYDLNRFVPNISETDYKALQEEPSRPLFSRSFQSSYPPASTYKSIVALAALNEGLVTERSTLYCGASLRVGNHTFNNWSKVPEGSIDVRKALARSCNTWFYQIGIDMGPEYFLDLSRRLGMGEKTGLPLLGETSGLVPSNDWMLKNEKRKILNGDTANMSIGQGSLLASPLQVAQLMAGIGNGGALPKLGLILQIQDQGGRVIQAMMPEQRNSLGVNPSAAAIVRDGMRDVVAQGYGTGRSGNLSYTTLAGKTGTAQWGPPKLNQRLAWFAGFLPHDNPRYAFAVLYEGKPGQKVSGGRMAAPMVRNFFEPLEDDIKDIIEPPRRAVVVIPDGEMLVEPEKEVLKAIAVDEETLNVDFEVDQENRAIPVTEEEVSDGSE